MKSPIAHIHNIIRDITANFSLHASGKYSLRTSKAASRAYIRPNTQEGFAQKKGEVSAVSVAEGHRSCQLGLTLQMKGT